jgi:H+/Cl- antiporter ClcA
MLKSIFLLILLAIILTFANSVNSFFVDLKNTFLKNQIHYQLLMYVIFWIILIGLMFLFTFLYSGNLESEKFIKML